jgi:hypothetical protein
MSQDGPRGEGNETPDQSGRRQEWIKSEGNRRITTPNQELGLPNTKQAGKPKRKGAAHAEWKRPGKGSRGKAMMANWKGNRASKGGGGRNCLQHLESDISQCGARLRICGRLRYAGNIWAPVGRRGDLAEMTVNVHWPVCLKESRLDCSSGQRDFDTSLRHTLLRLSHSDCRKASG